MILEPLRSKFYPYNNYNKIHIPFSISHDIFLRSERESRTPLSYEFADGAHQHEEKKRFIRFILLGHTVLCIIF